MKELLEYIKKFDNDRDWQQFHSPNNLAKSIVIEANELLEHFQFSSECDNKEEAIDELADVISYCLGLCIQLNVDPKEIVYNKYKKNEKKYPVELVKGSSKKYTEYKCQQ